MTQSGNPFSRFAQRLLPAGRRPRPSERTRERRDEILGYEVTDPTTFKMGQFAAPDNLYLAFKQLENEGGHGPGIDGYRPQHFSESEIRPIFRFVSERLRNGTYRPWPVRAVSFPKPSGKLRTLRLQRFTDRAVAKALLSCLQNFWIRRINRLSRWQIFAALDREIRRRRWYILAIDDIRDCFPNAPLNEIMEWHARYINRPVLLRLIDAVVRGHDGPSRVTGLDQGSPYSPVAMDVLLHHILDRVMTTRSSNTLLFRYVDNLTYLCRNVSDGITALEIAHETLRASRFQLKSEDGEPFDLRDQNHGHVILGLIPTWRDGQLTFSIPESEFDKLRQGLRYSQEADQPTKDALSRCIGWLQAAGPALTTTAERGIVDRVMDEARQAGFRNVILSDLLAAIAQARRSWHRVLGATR